MIQFMESYLTVPEGAHMGRKFVLRPWQKQAILDVYEPVWESGIRVVRKAIFSVAKKNGKTPLVSGLCLGHLVGPEAKTNEQIYSGAFDRDQASIVFRYMSQMVYLSEELSDLLVIRESRKEIYCKHNGSVYRALSSEIKGKHGLGPAVLVMDELAQFGADRTFYDTLIQGRGAHAEPILWIISTQAADDISVLSEEIDYGLKINRGEIEDPTVKCFLYTVPDDTEDIHNPEVWKMANPALGDFLSAADMEEASRTAKNMPSAEANFRNLRLNQRIDSSALFIMPSVWKANGDPVNYESFEQYECYGGLDLSAKNDLTALILVAEGRDHNWNVWSHFWTPLEGLGERENRDKAPYKLWVRQKFIEARPGRVIDYKWVAKKIAEVIQKVRLVALKFDRWRIDDLHRELDEIGVQCWIEGVDWKPEDRKPIPQGLRLVPHGQGFKDMNPAVELLEDLLTENRINHEMNPVLTWCASNTRIQSDPAGNRKFDKLKSTGRIDGIVALAMALNGAATIESRDSVYETRGLLSL